MGYSGDIPKVLVAKVMRALPDGTQLKPEVRLVRYPPKGRDYPGVFSVEFFSDKLVTMEIEGVRRSMPTNCATWIPDIDMPGRMALTMNLSQEYPNGRPWGMPLPLETRNIRGLIEEISSESEQRKKRLLEIADLIEPIERLHDYRLQAFLAHGNDDDYVKLIAFTRECNAKLEPLVRDVAEATENTGDKLVSVYRPQSEIHLYFNHKPARFVRLVAKYGSFNEQFWLSKGWKGWKGIDD